jgi:hypothetical protein
MSYILPSTLVQVPSDEWAVSGIRGNRHGEFRAFVTRNGSRAGEFQTDGRGDILASLLPVDMKAWSQWVEEFSAIHPGTTQAEALKTLMEEFNRFTQLNKAAETHITLSPNGDPSEGVRVVPVDMEPMAKMKFPNAVKWSPAYSRWVKI